ncbi:MAG: ABC transporter ATP-binding protein, partial [Cyanobacteria bacterium P01_D01_bin.2]
MIFSLPNPLPRLRRDYQEILSLLGNTPRLVQLVWSASPGWLIVSIMLTLVSALVPVGQLYISKLIVDQVVLILASDGGGFTTYLLLLVVTGLGLLLVGEVLSQLDNYVSRVLNDQFLLHANVQLLQQAMRLDLAHYESSEFHDVLNRAQQSGSNYPLRVVELLSRLLGSITRLVG